MKKLLFNGLLLVSAAANAKVTVDFWNRTNQPLYSELAKEQYPPVGQFVNELSAFDPANKGALNRIKRAGQHFSGQAAGMQLLGDYVQVEDWDLNGKTVILLSKKKDIKKGDRAVLITVNPKKDIYLVIDEEPTKGKQLFEGDNKKYTIREQRGPQIAKWIGKDITERGLDRKDIAKESDLQINTNYIVGENLVEKPMSDKEKAIFQEGKPLTEEEIAKTVGTLKGLGIEGDLD
jgi:hypothetical protein